MPKKPGKIPYSDKERKTKDAPNGRPTLYTEELADKIIDRIASHTMSIRKLCEMYDDMPSCQTIYLWVYRYPDFSDKYVVAKQTQSKLAVEEIEDLYKDVNTFKDKDGNMKYDAAHVAHLNNIANHRKWCAARLARKTYGADKDIEDVKNKNEELEEKLTKLRKDMEAQHEKDY